jgi:hypothetical protein
MTAIAKVQAIGEGGYVDAGTGIYISATEPTLTGFTTWVENLVNHGKMKLVEGPYEGSNWAEFNLQLAAAEGDFDKAWGEYSALLPATGKKAEPAPKVVADAADLAKQEAAEKPAKAGKGADAAKANAAPAAE